MNFYLIEKRNLCLCYNKPRGEPMYLEIKSLFIPTENKERTLRILLPDDYDHSEQSYPVLYMHDGQNLFEDKTSFSGHSWGVYETLKRHKIDHLIVVGIDNSDLRLFEYSPWTCSDIVKEMTKIEVGGLGDVYASWMVYQLKPWVESNYRVDTKHAMIAGSSMGAYISCYIANKYPEFFQTVGIFSLASWFNEPKLLSFMESQETNQNQRYFISVGSHESENEKLNQAYINNSVNLKDLLLKKGITDLLFVETDEGHNELAWRLIFERFIDFAVQKKHGN